ncbi:hypothetical protein HK099_006602 [Clydaea vesicula]|uniref:Uncharacterized protein n=1 Tax=Clydaea vesicula TaxID=447962 RepID=A0AAD5TZS3_9FUNG|nr:hypothetical protein HK099_006602 [Clydaea vesicula]
MIIPIEIFDIIINYSDDIAIHIDFNRKYKTLKPWNMKFLKTIDDKMIEGDIEYIMKLNKARILVSLTNMIYYKLPFIIKFRCSKLLGINLIDSNTRCVLKYDTLMYYDRHDVINKLSMSAKDYVKTSDYHIYWKFEWNSEESCKAYRDYDYFMDYVQHTQGTYDYGFGYEPYEYSNIILLSNSIIFDDIEPFTFGCTGLKPSLIAKDSYNINDDDYYTGSHEDWIEEKINDEADCVKYCSRPYE